MSVRIVTDSTGDLPADLVAEHGLTVVPVYVNLDGRSYRDGVDLPRQAFYARQRQARTPPTTAAPSPAQFQAVYEALAAQGATAILSLHLSGKLSSVLAAAQTAAAATTAVPVLPVDTGQLSMGVGFTALAAARAAAAGQSPAEIAAGLAALAPRVHVFAAIDTLDPLRRSGRLNLLQAGLAGLLQIKPLLKLSAGVIQTERVRTWTQATRRLLELVRERGPLAQIAILHTAARERAEAWLAEARPHLPAGDIRIVEAAPAIGTHIGPGAIGVACVQA